MSAICAARSSVTRCAGSSPSSATTSGARTTSGTGARPSGCSSSIWSTWARRRRSRSCRSGTSTPSTARPGPPSTPTRPSASAAVTAWCSSSPVTPRRCGSGRSWWPRASATSTRSIPSSVSFSPTTTSSGRASTTRCSPTSSPTSTPWACWWRATGPGASFPPASPTETVIPSRSSSRSRTVVSATPPPTWPPSGTGSRAWAPPASSTWWELPRPSISRCASPPPPWPAGCPRRSTPPTSPSAASSTPTARCSRRARANASSSSTSSTRPSNAPGRRWRRRTPTSTWPAAPRWRRCSASAPSSTPTCPPRGRATTSSTGSGCWPSRGTPPRTCSTPTRASAPSSGAPLAVPAPGSPPVLAEPAERALALSLLGFADAVAGSLASWSPSRLCTYLFDLAATFTGFYETCPVLKAPTEELRLSRLGLSDLTARVLAQGLGLLGITAPDQM